jgi:hypothetical protein
LWENAQAPVSGIGNETDQQDHALERIRNCTRDPTEGRRTQGCYAQRVCDQRVRATFWLCHNRDAPRTRRAVVCGGGTVPRRLRLHVWWSGHAIEGAATNARLGRKTSSMETTLAVKESGRRLPSGLGDERRQISIDESLRSRVFALPHFALSSSSKPTTTSSAKTVDYFGVAKSRNCCYPHTSPTAPAARHGNRRISSQ